MQAFVSNGFVSDSRAKKNVLIDERLVEAVEASLNANKKQKWAVYSAACLAFLSLPKGERASLLHRAVGSVMNNDMETLINAAREQADDVAGRISPEKPGVHAAPQYPVAATGNIKKGLIEKPKPDAAEPPPADTKRKGPKK